MTDFTPFSTSLRADGLTLSRGGRTVLTGLSLTAEPGSALLLTGRNGAGKTTLLRALGGLLRPESGSVTLNGEAARRAAPSLCAWLGHADGVKPSETVCEALTFAAKLHGTALHGINAAMNAMGVAALGERPCGRLSRGQARRVAITRILLSQRPVWLLDEPAGPLDTDGRTLLAGAVAAHRARGGVVIAATHQTLDWPDAQIVEIGT